MANLERAQRAKEIAHAHTKIHEVAKAKKDDTLT